MTKSNTGLHPVWGGLLASLAPLRVVTLVGGGGKTSLMYYLAGGLKDTGAAAFAATTARLLPPRAPGQRAVTAASLEEARRAVVAWRDSDELVTLARPAGAEGKLGGLEPEWVDALAAECPDVFFVVEGDGAAGLPLKGHLAHEPVVPAATRLLVPVAGADAVGQPLADGCVHRPARAAALAGVAEGDIATAEVVARLLLHPEGYLHNSPSEAVVVPFINKAEDGAGYQAAQDLAAAVLAAGHPAVAGVVFGSVRNKTFRFVGK